MIKIYDFLFKRYLYISLSLFQSYSLTPKLSLSLSVSLSLSLSLILSFFLFFSLTPKHSLSLSVSLYIFIYIGSERTWQYGEALHIPQCSTIFRTLDTCWMCLTYLQRCRQRFLHSEWTNNVSLFTDETIKILGLVYPSYNSALYHHHENHHHHPHHHHLSVTIYLSIYLVPPSSYWHLQLVSSLDETQCQVKGKKVIFLILLLPEIKRLFPNFSQCKHRKAIHYVQWIFNENIQ